MRDGGRDPGGAPSPRRVKDSRLQGRFDVDPDQRDSRVAVAGRIPYHGTPRQADNPEGDGERVPYNVSKQGAKSSPGLARELAWMERAKGITVRLSAPQLPKTRSPHRDRNGDPKIRRTGTPSRPRGPSTAPPALLESNRSLIPNSRRRAWRSPRRESR